MACTAVLIGAGIIGDYHLKAMAELDGVNMIAIADINLDKAQLTAKQYGIEAFQNYQQMVEQLQPDIAIIALPHFLHTEAAIFCANHGCHLLVEKPMATSSQACTDIIEAVERNGVIMLVGQTQQYIGRNLDAKKIIQSGRLGQLVMIHDNRHDVYFTEQRPKWFLDKTMSGGGIVFNLGIHAIDKIQWLTDSRIAKVNATVSYCADGYPDVEGSAVMLLETDAGVPCTVSLSGYNGVAYEDTELVFTNGMIKIGPNNTVSVSVNGKYEVLPQVETRNPFQLQLIDLLACIEEQRQPYASGEYGRSVVQVAEAVYLSSTTKSTVNIAK
ncbi:gfo/Idh/MocA family oxidoreductase [Paenibacillaceae bacterium]|nr:gfo/Idh/MocA family oxidoreductase [Paenibacillaceae bacterium]